MPRISRLAPSLNLQGDREAASWTVARGKDTAGVGCCRGSGHPSLPWATSHHM